MKKIRDGQKKNNKVADLVVSTHAGPVVACTVTRSKKGMVVRCEINQPEEDTAEHSDLSGDLEGVEAEDADRESTSAKSKGKVLTDGAPVGDQEGESPDGEQDEEDGE